MLRKTGESEGWNALLEADRLDLSFEDMALTAAEPIRDLFTDEDRRLAAQILGEQGNELSRKHDERQAEAAEREAEAVQHDRRIVADVRKSREAARKPWTPEIESDMLTRIGPTATRGNDRLSRIYIQKSANDPQPPALAR